MTSALRSIIRQAVEDVEKLPHAPSCPQDAERDPCEDDCPGCIHDGASWRVGPAIPHRYLPRRPCNCGHDAAIDGLKKGLEEKS